MTKIKHIYQPTAHTCGPACLYMVFKYLTNRQSVSSDVNFTIEDIALICGTDWEVGTPPDRMEKGMKELDIKYIEHINSPNPFNFLQSVIDNGNIPVLRTITKDAPHWIIVDGYKDYENDGIILYNILDPWLGEIKYTEKDLEDIWAVRDYQFFEIKNVPSEKFQINIGIGADEIDDVLERTYPMFAQHLSKKNFKDIVMDETNWDISLKLSNSNNELIGFYLLGSTQLTTLLSDSKFEGLNGVQGVLLAVNSDYRNRGLGNMLKDYPKTMGYDYIWGEQLKSLDNIEDWLKRRELILETEYIYITCEIFNEIN